MIPALEFFATNEAVELLEAALKAATGIRRAPALMAVAWQMRQRDTQRAVALADEAQRLLQSPDQGGCGADPTPTDQPELSCIERDRLKARAMLVHAEAKRLFGELDSSLTLAESALKIYSDLDDPIGCADAHWLLYVVLKNQGDRVRGDAELDLMIDAVRGAEPVRLGVAQATRARDLTFRDVALARSTWAALFVGAPLHPAAQSCVETFRATVADFSGEYALAIGHYRSVYALSLETGQIVNACGAACNIGVALNGLNDSLAALDWMERALELARTTGWLGLLAGILGQTAETLRRLGRLDAARKLLLQTLTDLASISETRHYLSTLNFLGRVELDLKEFASALSHYQLLEQRARSLRQQDLIRVALLGQARALLQLEQPQKALELAQMVLTAPGLTDKHKSDTFRLLAEIHAAYALPPPIGVNATSVPLHYLRQAVDLAAGIQGNTVPSDLLEALARAHADAGEMQEAYQCAVKAMASREKTHSTEARNHAIAMEVKHETQRAQANAELQRQLAKAQADRADVLEQANRAYQSVLENAQDAIVLTDREGCIKNWNRQAVLTFGWTLEDARGRDIAAMVFPARFHATVAATLSRQRQVLQDAPRAEMIAVRRDGSEFPIELSLTSVNVWGQSECSFFIRDISQRRKAELEITESLDKQLELADIKSRFVSMASHEFRTPLTLILSASDLLKSFGARMGELERAQCHDSIKHAVKRMTDMLEDVLLIGESDAGEAQFKPIPIDLRRLCESIVNEVGLRHGQSARAPHPIELRVPGGLFKVDLDERWFRHIFCNLLSNAIKYSPDGGAVVFQVAQGAEEIEFLVIDNGIGLPKEDIPRIFESFFRASNIGNIAGNGLGLSIAKRAVELHGGHISVSSELGLGTTFKVVLPAMAVR